MSTCLSFDSEYLNDGAGSQVMRQMGVYLVSRYFRFPYHHVPISTIDGNYGDGLDSKLQMEEFLRNLDSKLNLGTHTCSHSNHDHVIKLPGLGASKFRILAKLTLIRAKSLLTRRLLVEIGNPNEFLNRNTFLFKSIRNSTFEHELKKNRHIEIHMHILAARSYNHNYDRFLPLDYFVSLAEQILQFGTNKGLLMNFVIHTDAPESETTWFPPSYTSAQTIQAYEKEGLLREDGGVKINPFEKTKFDFLQNLSIRRNLNPLESWEIMSSADILVTSKSMFSVIGGILCNSPIVFSPDFSFPGLPGWIKIEDNNPNDSINKDKISAALSRLMELKNA